MFNLVSKARQFLGMVEHNNSAKSLNARQVNRLMDTARKGEPRAQFELGQYYCQSGPDQNPELGLDYLRSAANQDNAHACALLGLIHSEGKLVPLDLTIAIQWYEMGDKLGDTQAQYILGSAYETGRFGLNPNPGLAHDLFLRAALQDHGPSQSRLASYYAKSYGVVEDKPLAMMWAELALLSGHSAAIRVKHSLARHMTAQQLIIAKKLVESWPIIRASHGKKLPYYRGLYA